MKKSLAKKGLAYLLMASMVLTSMPLTAFAEDTTEELTTTTEGEGEGLDLDQLEGKKTTAEASVDGKEMTLSEAIKEANKTGDVTIEILNPVNLTDIDTDANEAALAITADNVTINGNNNIITANYDGTAHVLGINGCDGVIINDLNIVGEGNESHGINIYESTNVTLNNVSVEGVNKVGIVVNASTVKATGKITLEDNGWGNGINVGWGDGAEALECLFDATEANMSGVDTVYTDDSDVGYANGKPFNISLSSRFVKVEDPKTYFGDKDTIWLPETSTVATVKSEDGEKYYFSLKDAIENAPDGATVKLNNDADIKETISIENKNLIFDLGGNIVTIKEKPEEKSSTTFDISAESEKDVTIKNGTIIDETGKDNPPLAQYVVKSFGAVNLYTEDLTVNVYAGNVSNDPDKKYFNYVFYISPDELDNVGTYTVGSGTEIIELTNGETDTYGTVAITVKGLYNNGDDVPENYEGTKIIVKDGASIEATSYAISGNGTSHGTTIIIEGGSLISKGGTAIYHPQYGNLVVEDGYICGNNSGIEIRSGNLDIKDGTIKGLAKPINTEPNGNGTTSSGAGVAIAQHTTKLPISVDITGGTIEGYSALYQKNVQNHSDDILEKINISVSGGKFNAINGGTVSVYSENKKGFITGGTFSTVPTEYLADGLDYKEIGGKFVVVNESEENVVATVAGKPYYTFEEAVKAAMAAEETLSLQKDVDMLEKVVIDKPLTIVGNGHAITGQNDNRNVYFEITDGTFNISNVTLKDFGGNDNKTANGVGVFKVPSGSDNVVFNANNVTVKNFNRSAFDIRAGKFEIYKSTIDCANQTDNKLTKGLVTGLYGSKVEGSIWNTSIINSASNYKEWSSSAIEVYNNSDVNIVNCTISDVQNGIHVDNYWAGTTTFPDAPKDANTIVDISGGTISVINPDSDDSSAVRIYGKEDQVRSASVTIKNGTFNGKVKIVGENKNDEIEIEGGTFLFDPSEFVSSPYRVRENDDKTFEVYKKSSGGSSSSSGGSSSSSTTTETTENEDGSVTTTETKSDGTVIETTKYEDGSTLVVEETKDGTKTTTETDKVGNKTRTIEREDGSKTITIENTDGSKSKTEIDEDGQVTSTVEISKETVEDAKENNKNVSLPIPPVELTDDREDATTITVDLPEDTKVEIPVDNVTSGTVAVKVNEDGSEEVIKTTLTTEDSIVVTLSDGDTVKVVDNSKHFTDVDDSYWGIDAINFVTSREIFSGITETTFGPDLNMSRAMVWTVLARIDGQDTTGEIWYSAGQKWAIQNGISDGTNPEGNITREQLAAMLYRYAQLKGYDTTKAADLSKYTDAKDLSAYAVTSMQWAVEEGIINGMTETMIVPNGNATRDQTAMMLMNFFESVNK